LPFKRNVQRYIAAVAHFFSHAANRRVPRAIDAFGAVVGRCRLNQVDL
jgi:hypothetical protein